MRSIVTINAGESAIVNVPTGSNHIVYFAHGLSASRGLYLVTTQGAGNISTRAVVEPANVTFTNGINKWTIANGTQYTLAVYAMRVNGGLMTV